MTHLPETFDENSWCQRFGQALTGVLERNGERLAGYELDLLGLDFEPFRPHLFIGIRVVGDSDPRRGASGDMLAAGWQFAEFATPLQNWPEAQPLVEEAEAIVNAIAGDATYPDLHSISALFLDLAIHAACLPSVWASLEKLTLAPDFEIAVTDYDPPHIWRSINGPYPRRRKRG